MANGCRNEARAIACRRGANWIGRVVGIIQGHNLSVRDGFMCGICGGANPLTWETKRGDVKGG